MDSFIRFLNDFLKINPTPTKEQLNALGMSLGLDVNQLDHFVSSMNKKAKIKALTTEEKSLNNDINPDITSPDYVIMLDGDDTSMDPGDQSALENDGAELENNTDSDQKALSIDGV